MEQEAAESGVFNTDFDGEIQFNESFLDIMENQKNGPIISIIEQFSSPNVADGYGHTLLHWAVHFGNIGIINYLLDRGSVTHLKNNDNETPLMSALANGQFEAAKIVFERRTAEVAGEDLQMIVQCLWQRNESEEAINFIRLLKDTCKDWNSIADALTSSSFEFIQRIGDVRLTHLILKRKKFLIGGEKFLKYAMQYNVQGLRDLWIGNPTIRKPFFHELLHTIENQPPQWDDNIKNIFRRFTEWVEYDTNLIEFLTYLFRQCNPSAIIFLLFALDIDVQIKQAFGFDVLPLIFAQRDSDLIGFVLTRDFDVNSKTHKGMTALHFASAKRVRSNIRLLLEIGADCNARNDIGYPPIRYVQSPDCAEILLLHGADIQVEDNEKRTLIDELDYYSSTWKIWLQQIAIEEFRGVAVKQKIMDKINSNKKYRTYYDLCSDQIRELKEYKPISAFPDLSLFRILSEKPETLPLCVRSQKDVTTTMGYCRNLSVFSFYQSKLQFSLDRIVNVYRAKTRAAELISNATSVITDYSHLAIDKIFGYLIYKDVLAIAST